MAACSVATNSCRSSMLLLWMGLRAAPIQRWSLILHLESGLDLGLALAKETLGCSFFFFFFWGGLAVSALASGMLPWACYIRKSCNCKRWQDAWGLSLLYRKSHNCKRWQDAWGLNCCSQQSTSAGAHVSGTILDFQLRGPPAEGRCMNKSKPASWRTIQPTDAVSEKL